MAHRPRDRSGSRRPRRVWRGTHRARGRPSLHSLVHARSELCLEQRSARTFRVGKHFQHRRAGRPLARWCRGNFQGIDRQSRRDVASGRRLAGAVRASDSDGSTPATHRRAFAWSLLIGVILAAVAVTAVLAFVFLPRRNAPQPVAAVDGISQMPELNLDKIDPQIAGVIERARAAVKREPRSGTAWGTLGVALMAHKLNHEALACFVEAEKRQGNEPRWAYFQGIAL